jgi:hypothetical protein
MGARGIYHAQETHIVNLIPPVSVAGGKTTGVFNMKNWEHASIVLQFGVQSAALKSIQLQSSDNGSPANTTAIPFDLFKCETGYTAANGDVLEAKVSAVADGFTEASANNIFYVIEMDSATLPAGQDYVQVVITDNSPAASSVLASAVVILSGGRFVHDQSETVLV